MFADSSGTYSGPIRAGSLARASSSRSPSMMPPAPVWTVMPVRSASSSSIPASARASVVAATASCENRPMRRATRRSMNDVASKSGISPPAVASSPWRAGAVSRRMPERPSQRASQ